MQAVSVPADIKFIWSNWLLWTVTLDARFRQEVEARLKDAAEETVRPIVPIKTAITNKRIDIKTKTTR